MVEREEEIADMEAKIQLLQNKIEKHNKGRMRSFHTKDRGAGATDCAELGAHGYEVGPRKTLWMKAEL